MDTATIRRIGAPAAAAALLLAVTLALPGCTTKVVATGATPQEAITAAGTGVALSKPDRADVWVDGKYVGEARDLDGYPSYLWLEKGPHPRSRTVRTSPSR